MLGYYYFIGGGFELLLYIREGPIVNFARSYGENHYAIFSTPNFFLWMVDFSVSLDVFDAWLMDVIFNCLRS